VRRICCIFDDIGSGRVSSRWMLDFTSWHSKGAALTTSSRRQLGCGSTALSSKRGQCHVDSQGTRLNTDLLTIDY